MATTSFARTVRFARLAVFFSALAGGGAHNVIGDVDGGGAAGNGGAAGAAGPMCTAVATSEASCSDGKDDDCDGFVDCLDTDCDGQPCGNGLTCSGGACRAPCAAGDASCVPELPVIQNVKVLTRGDTVTLDFEPVVGAVDYRIYPEPAASDWLIGAAGEVGVKNGIYRCAGDRVFQNRAADTANLFDCSISGCANTQHNYTRTEADSHLGYVFLTPAADRVPVYRLADPHGGAGFRNADWVVPLYSEANSAEYVTDPATRDALLAKGWRDDGIAFYTLKDPAAAGMKTIYRIKYAPGVDWQGDNVVFFFSDGPGARRARRAARGGDRRHRLALPGARRRRAGERGAPPRSVPGQLRRARRG